MAPLPTDTIAHFLHPAHKLNHLTTNTPYICDGCKVHGNGTRFSCTICDFDLHEYCAKCPTRLTSTTSHQHPMSLVVHNPNPNLTISCQICLNPVQALAYQCKSCNFWVHPLCILTNSGHNQHRSVPSGSTRSVAPAARPAAQPTARPAAQPTAQPAAQRIGEQIAVGMVTNGLYDVIKPPDNINMSIWGDVPSADSGQVPSAGPCEEPSAGLDTDDAEEDDGGFFSAIKSGFISIFESVSES